MRSQEELEEWLRLEEMKFRISLKQKRIESGLTLEELARAAGRSAQGLLAVENLDVDVSLSIVRRYCAAVGILLVSRVTPVEIVEEGRHAK